MTKMLLAIGLAIASASAVSAAEFTHPTLGYSLEYPDGWKIEQAGPTGQIVNVYTGPTGTSNVTVPRDVWLNVQVLDEKRGDDEAVLDSLSIPDFALRGPRKDVDRGGQHHRQLVSQITESFQSDGTPNYGLITNTITRIKGVRFLFLCETWDDAEGAREQKTCNTIIDSVNVHKGQKDEVQK